MRIDKYLSDSGKLSRREAADAVKHGRVCVNGTVVKNPSLHISETEDNVTLDGAIFLWKRFTYVLLDKPEGYISSTEKNSKTVMKLLPPEYSARDMFPCGRLDRDTTGVLLITNDGELAHLLLSPKRHVSKEYAFELSLPAPVGTEKRFKAGITIDGGELCAPAEVIFEADRRSGKITLTEGKFHEVKRMFAAVGTEVIRLRRIRFGPICEDESLGLGEWRELGDDEVLMLADSVGILR